MNVYSVICSVRAKPLDLYRLVRKDNPYDQAILIAHDVKHHPVIGNQAGFSIDPLQFIKIFELTRH